MKKLLKSPIFNAVCISLFTAFYAIVFMIYSGDAHSGFTIPASFIYIACALIAVTLIVVILLVTRRRAFDEYHTSILLYCLAAAIILTLLAIAIFFLVIVNVPVQIAEKFTIFIVIHWAMVVLSDLVYVLLCRWK